MIVYISRSYRSFVVNELLSRIFILTSEEVEKKFLKGAIKIVYIFSAVLPSKGVRIKAYIFVKDFDF